MIRLQERLVSSVTRFSWEFSGHRDAFFFFFFCFFLWSPLLNRAHSGVV